jgi:aldose 1-epimerase
MVHLLQNDVWRVGVLPQTAASLAFAQICHQGVWRDFMRPTPTEAQNDPLSCASYLLVPWSNRIRDAKFRFGGQEYQLQPSFADGTAIHGVGRHYAWQVVSADDVCIRLEFDSRQYDDVDFPFAFRSWVEYQLVGSDFRTRLGVQNVDTQAMPAGFGTHPMLQRTLTHADDTLALELPFTEAYPVVDCLPTGSPVAVPDALDYRQMRQAGEVFVDDCLTGRNMARQIMLKYSKSNVQITHWLDFIYTHLVMYMPVGESFIALEPVTNANDGFNLAAAGATNHGVFVLQPGEMREAMSGYMLTQ